MAMIFWKKIAKFAKMGKNFAKSLYSMLFRMPNSIEIHQNPVMNIKLKATRWRVKLEFDETLTLSGQLLTGILTRK